jgi:hypothetical protein
MITIAMLLARMAVFPNHGLMRRSHFCREPGIYDASGRPISQ